MRTALRTSCFFFLVTAVTVAAAIGCEPDIPKGLGVTTGAPASPTDTTTSVDSGSPAAPSPTAPSAPSAPSSGVDAVAVLAPLGANGYQTSPAFTEITRAPYPSVAVPGVLIREWVSTSAAPVYEAISPGVSGSNVTLPPGTTIVRALLGDDGGVNELTVMFKGPAGYNPALGDWWFGVTDPNATPLQDDAGAEEGLLTGCYTCHTPRNLDDYLFGVPLDDRASAADAGDDSGTAPSSDAGTDDDAGDDGGSDADTHDGGHHRGGH